MQIFDSRTSYGNLLSGVLLGLGSLALISGAVQVAVADGRAWLVALLGLGAAVCLVLLPRLARRLRYTLTDGVLTVPAHFRAVRLPLAGARFGSGRLLGVRIGGSAVPGFYLGRFADWDGSFHVAATARDGLWVRAEGRRVFISPADPAGFEAALIAAGATRDTPQ